MRYLVAAILIVSTFGCQREQSSPKPVATGSSDGYSPTNTPPGIRTSGAPNGIFIETPITSTSRLVFGGYEWKRDPTGSDAGAADLPEMNDDGIEDSFTAYVTHDPNLRLFYMLTGSEHRIYVRERSKTVT